jgi:hypothetical protein
VLGNGQAVQYPFRHHEARMAGLAPAGSHAPPPSRPAPLHEGRPGQPARRPRALYRQHHLPDPWIERAGDHRRGRLLGLHPHDQRGRHRPLQPRQGRLAGRGSSFQRPRSRDNPLAANSSR